MKPEHEKFLKVLRDGAEKNLRRSDHLEPIVFILGGMGADIAVPWLYRSSEEKYALVGMYRHIAQQIHAAAVAIVSEAWLVDAESAGPEEMRKLERREMSAEQSKFRREHAMTMLQVRGSDDTAVYVAPITRTTPLGNDDGKFVALGEWRVLPGANAGDLQFFDARAKA